MDTLDFGALRNKCKISKLLSARHYHERYKRRMSVGTGVPDGFVGRFTLARMDELIERMSAAAKAMPSHYTQEHSRVVLPDGKEIPAWSRESP